MLHPSTLDKMQSRRKVENQCGRYWTEKYSKQQSTKRKLTILRPIIREGYKRAPKKLHRSAK
jgi:hypothetical protein